MPIPVQIDPFGACGKNKEAIQKIWRGFYSSINRKSQRRIVLSGCVTDSEGMKPWIELYQGDLQTCLDLYLMIEVADSRITPHFQKAVATFWNLAQVVIFRYPSWGKSGTPGSFYCSEMATHVFLEES